MSKKPNDNSEEKKLGHVNYEDMTLLDFALKYYDWRLYGERAGVDIKDKAAVTAYLERIGFKRDKTLAEKRHDEKVEYAKQKELEELAREYGR